VASVANPQSRHSERGEESMGAPAYAHSHAAPRQADTLHSGMVL